MKMTTEKASDKASELDPLVHVHTGTSTPGQSIYGPSNTKARFIFFVTVIIMIFCASNNDFLGKLTYQALPSVYTVNGILDYFKQMVWIAWLLSFGTFFVCSFGLIIGWNNGKEWLRFRQSSYKIWISFFIAGCCHVWMNGCRYIGLLFLPAPIVTILKSGSQLLFSALFRYIFENKKLIKLQQFGILLTCIGLCFVIIPVYLQHEGQSASMISYLIGIILLLSVGFVGALRNNYEQIFLRMNFNVKFTVGLRSFFSLCITGIIAIIMSFLNLPPTLDAIKYYPFFILFFVLFLLAIFCKNMSQMAVIKLSSAVTRNLFMQLVPSITWILSLSVHYIVIANGGGPEYGEAWDNYQLIRLLGFAVVFIGSYLYMKHKQSSTPKKQIYDALSVQQTKTNP